jgi:hypothetical protein
MAMGASAGSLAGDDPPGEGYLAKVFRLDTARAIAQELVLMPYLDTPAEDGSGQI